MSSSIFRFKTGGAAQLAVIVALFASALSLSACRYFNAEANIPGEGGDLDVETSDSEAADFAEAAEVAGDMEGEPQKFSYLRITPYNERQGQVFAVAKPVPKNMAVAAAPIYNISGSAMADRGGGLSPLGGDIVFSPVRPNNLPAILGVEPVTASLSELDGTFKTSLLAGLYDIFLYPKNKPMPPFIPPMFKIAGLELKSGDGFIQFDLTGAYPVAAGYIAGFSNEQVAGLKVRAKNGNMRSTEGSIYAGGSFTLYLPSVEGAKFSLEIDGRFDSRPFVPKRVYPSIISVEKQDPNLEFYSTKYWDASSGDELPVLLLDYSKLYSGACRVNGKLLIGNKSNPLCKTPPEKENQAACAPVKKAGLIFKSVSEHGEFIKTLQIEDKRGAAASEGGFEVMLYPGHYDVYIVPDQTEPAGAAAWKLDCTAISHGAENDQEYDVNFEAILEPKVKLFGAVVDAEDKPAAGALVEATYMLDNIVKTTRVYHFTTGADGSFSASLDKGKYLIVIKPPASSGLAYYTVPDFEIYGDVNMNFPLEKGEIISGKIIRNEKPLSGGALAELLEMTEDGLGAYDVASGEVNEEGEFLLVIPKAK